MNIDLRKFNYDNTINIDDYVTFNEEYLKGTEIRDIKNTHVEGTLSINSLEELVANLVVTGTFILPNSVTLEDISYDFETEIDENYGNIDNFFNKKQNSLDILSLIWENIVSEVPIRVTDGSEPKELNGDGWQYTSND
jgi:uncharacterized metal-binding protein YceD (DUF177 family)